MSLDSLVHLNIAAARLNNRAALLNFRKQSANYVQQNDIQVYTTATYPPRINKIRRRRSAFITTYRSVARERRINYLSGALASHCLSFSRPDMPFLPPFFYLRSIAVRDLVAANVNDMISSVVPLFSCSRARLTVYAARGERIGLAGKNVGWNSSDEASKRIDAPDAPAHRLLRVQTTHAFSFYLIFEFPRDYVLTV